MTGRPWLALWQAGEPVNNDKDDLMLRKFNIGPRLMMLIVVQAVILLLVGATAIYGLKTASQSTQLLNDNVTEGTRLDYVSGTLHEELLAPVYSLESGAVTWSEAAERISFARARFESDWSVFAKGVSADEAEFIRDVMQPGLESVRTAFTELEKLIAAENRSQLELFVVNDFQALVDPLLHALSASSAQRQIASAETFRSSLEDNRNILIFSLASIVVGLLLAGVIGALIHRSIAQPIARIAATVGVLAGGDLSVRSEVTGTDEVGRLGVALDGLLEDKVQSLAQAETAAAQLNESVLQVLNAVAQMSERDLTVTVPVTADVAGPVADAINQMAHETSTVLKRVHKLARGVGQTSVRVSKGASEVTAAAIEQSKVTEVAAKELAHAAKVLGEIAALARNCRNIADDTTTTTNIAMQTVNGTMSGMSEIRDAIQETGKRIKRLGERSQEINSIVEIINSIAERTHVLALNASMQAAAAGDAGRGFAVVADEVQRLSESSREATAQIGGLIKSIQVDTNDTIVTMDRTINQVVEGSRLAETAGQRMTETKDSTAKLVESVIRIAEGSEEQAKISASLRDRAESLVASTMATTRQLAAQVAESKKMVQYARALLQSVQVFKLPAS
jgi:twitching motility protein PilJ